MRKAACQVKVRIKAAITGGGDDRSDADADIDDAHGEGAFLLREPFGDGLDGGRQESGFSHAEQEAKEAEGEDGSGEGMSGAGERPPGDGEREPLWCPHSIDDPSGDGVHQGIGEHEGEEDLGIICGAYGILLSEDGGGDGERLPIQVIDDGRTEEEREHFSACVSYHHNNITIYHIGSALSRPKIRCLSKERQGGHTPR